MKKQIGFLSGAVRLSGERFPLVAETGAAALLTDGDDFEAVRIAASLLSGDLERVTGKRLEPVPVPGDAPLVIAGTLGRCRWIDRLAAEGRLPEAEAIRGRWEHTLWKIVEHPFPGVPAALVIAGSDRRGAAYGLTALSEGAGVSPWHWWSDIPPRRAEAFAVSLPGGAVTDFPAVRYRGIFINDEDWGLLPWARDNYERDGARRIGPKSYEKIFEVMLRLRLNCIWPAMHPVSYEFISDPENMKLADRYGIVAGSCHCEPMLRNNCFWESARGPWDYAANRDNIYNWWRESAEANGRYEAVWTVGIRGIHDAQMNGGGTLEEKKTILERSFGDQRRLLAEHVTDAWGEKAQCFVPYKEVLPVYDAGLEVPEDVTLIWVDDNFGYIRRLSSPRERTRSGGAGVYWHVSYFGRPHSYIYMNTTPPGLLWYELGKTYANDAKKLWILNVGDLKPADIAVDCYARVAWEPERFGPDAQRRLLHGFAARSFGEEYAGRIAAHLAEYYRLGTIRKPELMSHTWVRNIPPAMARQLETEYRLLLEEDEKIEAALPPELRDCCYETVGFNARMLAFTGLLFLACRDIASPVPEDPAVAGYADEIRALVARYDAVGGGKWRSFWIDPFCDACNSWETQMQWPWNDRTDHPRDTDHSLLPEAGCAWRSASSFDGVTERDGVTWSSVAGLGCSGSAMALLPATDKALFDPDDPDAPALRFRFVSASESGSVLIDFLPVFRLYPGLKLRVAVSVNGGEAAALEVPGSSGDGDETSAERACAVQDNFIRVRIPLNRLRKGENILEIRAVDPGAVVDRVALPAGK